MSRFSDIVSHSKEHVQEQDVNEVHSRLESKEEFKLVDVREDREWIAAHITGATHIGKGVLERDIEEAAPDLHTPIVLYCGGGVRSILAADSLQRMGYTHVVSMSGGFAGWKNAGLPVTTGDA
tara:strand:+ start:56 stop:424 length:369 start_codon:yes stop_codon:yes gene_type:complete